MTTGTCASASLIELLAAVLRGKDIRWDTLDVTSTRFLDVCVEHGLTGLVRQRLSGLQHENDWPSSVRAVLAHAARVEAAREVFRGQETASVLAELARAGVYPILFKGAALAYTVYDAPSLRPRSDTDLLVPREAVEAVRGALTRVGYSAPICCDGELLFCQFGLLRTDPRGMIHTFDVHWKISTQSIFANLLTYDEVAGSAVPVAGLGTYARGAGPLHALLLACIHPVMHHRNIERLIWVYDIHLLASQLSDADFAVFGDLALAKGVGAICAHELSHAQTRFGTRIPEYVTARLAAGQDHESSAAYLSPGRRWHDDLISSVRGLSGWKERLQLIREVVLPGPRYMLDAYGFARRPLASPFLPALYLHRLARGLVRVLVGRK